MPNRVEPRNEIIQTPSLVKIALNFLSNEITPLKGEERGRVNILFLGMTGVPHPAPFLTDTVILASIVPQEGKLGLISLPRDLLVQVPGKKTQTKINGLYALHERNPALIKLAAEHITGQPIDYFFALDISAVRQIVDDLGGLNVLVPEDVSDPRFPSESGGTESFTVEKGWRYFDGMTVQRYLRTRHSQDGDFARMRQQQAVLEALRKKVFGLHLLYDFPTILSIYGTLAEHIHTDVDESAMTRLYDIAKKISYDNVIQLVVDGDPEDPDALLKSTTVPMGGVNAYVLVPKTGDFDYYSIQEAARQIFEQKF